MIVNIKQRLAVTEESLSEVRSKEKRSFYRNLEKKKWQKIIESSGSARILLSEEKKITFNIENCT